MNTHVPICPRMSPRERLLAPFKGIKPDRPAWLADLTYWQDAAQRAGKLEAFCWAHTGGQGPESASRLVPSHAIRAVRSGLYSLAGFHWRSRRGVMNTIYLIEDERAAVEDALAMIAEANDPAFEIMVRGPAELFHLCGWSA